MSNFREIRNPRPRNHRARPTGDALFLLIALHRVIEEPFHAALTTTELSSASGFTDKELARRHEHKAAHSPRLKSSVSKPTVGDVDVLVSGALLRACTFQTAFYYLHLKRGRVERREEHGEDLGLLVLGGRLFDDDVQVLEEGDARLNRFRHAKDLPASNAIFVVEFA